MISDYLLFLIFLEKFVQNITFFAWLLAEDLHELNVKLNW